MKFLELQHIVSPDRMSRYLTACNNDRRKALHLYKLNIKASLEMFAVVGAFEVALRNSINRIMIDNYGSDWLRDAVLPGGMFDIPQCRDHARIIRSAYEKLLQHHLYSHTHLLSKMEFGVWKYMFSSPQFRATNRVILRAFPNKPISNRTIQYNNTYIFNELDHVNSLRNRIAHHEPICFPTGKSIITTQYIKFIYEKIATLTSWLGIDPASYWGGLDHVLKTCKTIDSLS